MTKIPFDCKVWETQESFLVVAGKKVTIHVSLYSEGYTGKSKCIVVKNMVELELAECKDKILFLTEEFSHESLQPKDYPFYYLDGHKAIINCLEEKKPCAIIAVTGGTCMSGLNPFPVINLQKQVSLLHQRKLIMQEGL